MLKLLRRIWQTLLFVFVVVIIYIFMSNEHYQEGKGDKHKNCKINNQVDKFVTKEDVSNLDTSFLFLQYYLERQLQQKAHHRPRKT